MGQWAVTWVVTDSLYLIRLSIIAFCIKFVVRGLGMEHLEGGLDQGCGRVRLLELIPKLERDHTEPILDYQLQSWYTLCWLLCALKIAISMAPFYCDFRAQ